MNFGKENETTEFKESLAQFEKGIKSLTAMLNRSGRGTVYFGVDDNGNVKGLTLGKNTLMDIRSKIKTLVEPAIVPDIAEGEDEDGRKYVKLSASGSDMPYSFDGRYYERIVSADEIGEYEIRSTLDKLEEKLPADEFVRCHKSFLVSLRHIRKYKSGTITISSGLEIRPSMITSIRVRSLSSS